MSSTEPKLNLRVRSITYQGEAINAYELVDPNGGELPPFTAGAHVDIHLPGELIRQYSLCSHPADRRHYVICVQREDSGRGGSKAVHNNVRVGQIVSISHPRNNFPLAPDAARHVFLAGGIGITPVMAMVQAARAAGTPWQLTYCTRTPAGTAFLDELAPEIKNRRVTVHHDGGHSENSLDLQALLSRHEPGTHLYYCGPAGFMLAAANACAHWPRQAVHYEFFSVPNQTPASHQPGDAELTTMRVDSDNFQVKVNSTGAVYDVPEGRSIVQVLAENGINVETSCESGLCGTCRTDYIDGQPDHRDHILSDEDKARSVLICCARSLTPMLVLDL